ncbi:MAG: SPOR domain-containing protein [Bdellovibrio sp.]
MSSKTDAIVKLAIVFFISLLSFSIGTFVGKKYSDNQHQLSSLEPQKGEHTAERAVASESKEGEKAGAMTDDDIAKLAEEFVADDEKPGAAATATGHNSETSENHHGSTEKTEEAHTVNNHEKHEEPSFAAKNVAGGKAPVAAADTREKHANTKEERVPSSLPKDVGQFTAGKFTIQVASYADEGEAQRMASDLKNKGYSAFYFPASIKGKTWYRVSVGQFATLKEAQSYKSEFLSKSKVESAIIQKITE